MWERDRLARARLAAAAGTLVAKALREVWTPNDPQGSFAEFVSVALPIVRVTSRQANEISRLQFSTRAEPGAWRPYERSADQIASGFWATGWRSLEAERPLAVAQSLVLGVAARQVTSASQQSVIDSLRRSRIRAAYLLVNGSNPCWFCAMLASRGPVFQDDSFDESDPRFVGPGTARVHDNCGCSLVVVNTRESTEMATWQELEQQWKDVTGEVTGQAKLVAWRDHWNSTHTKPKVPRWSQFASA